MSRSIHATRNEYRRRKKFRYADDAAQEKDLADLRDELIAKQAIKQQVRDERADPLPGDLPPVDPASIPIRFLERGPALCHAVSEADLRVVMSRLPAGTIDGLSGITLGAGTEYQQTSLDAGETDPERDPWLGRIGDEELPGVWGGRILGTYFSEPTRIDLYAYAVTPDLADRSMWELLLRLWMLSTFVHEVAHHDDAMRRTGRGRWRMDDKDKVEGYAEQLQGEWTRDLVVPYLETAYPAEVAAIHAWMHRHGGLALPLGLVAWNWCWDEKGKVRQVWFGSAKEALQDLARDVHEGKDRIETRVDFANNLHYGANYSEAQAILASVVAEVPGHLGARTLQADILEHLADYGGAAALASVVLTESPDETDAWTVLANALTGLGQWERVLEAADRGAQTVEEGTYWTRRFLIHRTRALLELARYTEMEPELERLARLRGGDRPAADLRGVMLLRTGQLEEALALAEKAQAEPPGWWLPVLSAVRFEASARLGWPLPASELPPRYLASLRRGHHGAWVDRLVREFGAEEET
jgi:tetratricopeptide (TPR) repeat protein